MRGVFLALAIVAAAGPVAAQPPQSFTAQARVTAPMTPEAAYAAFVDIGRWWDHTWSGDPSNLRLEAKPGGCWCETLPKGGFAEHMRVVYAEPGKELRLQGGLGPMQAMGATGLMQVTFAPEAGGTRIDVRYVVHGADPAMAGPAQGVLQSQLERLAALASDP